MADPCSLTAVELAASVRAGTVTALQATEAALARMQALEPILHAFCTPTPELALATARGIDAAIAAGTPVGALAGVPIAIKDLICTKGIRTVSGSPAYIDFIPDEDDIVVERVKSAGAVILGKTNVPEFGYSGVGHNPVFETTCNPWNPERTSGGSSAGSGAAVAAGMCPLAFGSDGGGSVRIPAAHCGAFGMKPSMGRVPLYPGCRDERFPGMSGWESLEHIGPITRSVADAALMLSVIAGPDPRDRHSIPAGDIDWLECARPRTLTGLRVAYSADWGYAAVDPEVRRVVGHAVRVFESDLGCIVEEADPGFADPAEAFWALVAMETDLAGMRAMVETHGARMSPHLVAMVTRRWTAEEFNAAIIRRKQVTNALWRFMQRYDLLLTPTLAVPPFALGIQGPGEIDGRAVSDSAWLAFTTPLNMTGQPAASVPAGFTNNGLPVGLQIIGGHLDDAGVLRAAAAFEQARPWAGHVPPVVARLNQQTGTRP
ncbi:amidase [Lichenicoccus sp.]|uniref:amidase n=1 Tax=Lichenicoccus sp. TaxID=2781899 RepID=UPI003D10FB25